MRTLFISFSYLYGNGGGIYATKAYINAFAQLSQTLTLLYPAKDNTTIDGLSDNIIFEPVEDKRTKVSKTIDYILGHIHRFENISDVFFDPRKYDVVVFNNSTCSHRLIEKFKDVGMKTITIHHNFQLEYVKADYSFLLRDITLFWTKQFEGCSAVKSDLNLTLTQQDSDAIRHYYKSDAPFEVLGVFEFGERQIEKLTDTPNNKNRFIITGGLSDIQTQESLRLWIRKYYPIFKKIVPTAILTIAGKSPSKNLIEIAKNNDIILIPSPLDMRPLLKESDYYICPIDRGGGLKLRNMDGLKSGLPVLSHEVSVRGYENMVRAKCIYTYHDEKSFADSLTLMMDSDTPKDKILTCYNDEFSFHNGVCRLQTILRKYQFIDC